VEKHTEKPNRDFSKGGEDGLRQEASVENPIQEMEWKRELTIQNIRAKEEMAQELREMGFEQDAIGRILHLDEAERESEGNRVVRARSDRKE